MNERNKFSIEYSCVWQIPTGNTLYVFWHIQASLPDVDKFHFRFPYISNAVLSMKWNMYVFNRLNFWYIKVEYFLVVFLCECIFKKIKLTSFTNYFIFIFIIISCNYSYAKYIYVQYTIVVNNNIFHTQQISLPSITISLLGVSLLSFE